MSQERMEWLGKIDIRSAEDIRLTGVDEVYKLLIEAGLKEDENFLFALRGAVEGLDTIDVMKNVQKWEEGKA